MGQIIWGHCCGWEDANSGHPDHICAVWHSSHCPPVAVKWKFSLPGDSVCQLHCPHFECPVTTNEDYFRHYKNIWQLWTGSPATKMWSMGHQSALMSSGSFWKCRLLELTRWFQQVWRQVWYQIPHKSGERNTHRLSSDLHLPAMVSSPTCTQ